MATLELKAIAVEHITFKLLSLRDLLTFQTSHPENILMEAAQRDSNRYGTHNTSGHI
jgi:hypothetical protein